MTHILIIEDDKSMRSLLKTLLEMEHFRITTVDPRDMRLILSTIREDQPDIIFMDVNLKGVDGLSILDAIRQDPVLRTVNVLMTSGEDLRAACMNAGANDFLLKPYMPADLLLKLKSLA